MTITKEQIKIIHTLCHKNGIDDDLYRLMLDSHYDAASCKNLTFHQAAELAKLGGVFYSPDLANIRQQRLITAMFERLGFYEPKWRVWLFRCRSLMGVQNASEMSSGELLTRISQTEATALIAALKKTERYLNAKREAAQ